MKDSEICEVLNWINKSSNKDTIENIFAEAIGELKVRIPLIAKAYFL